MSNSLLCKLNRFLLFVLFGLLSGIFLYALLPVRYTTSLNLAPAYFNGAVIEGAVKLSERLKNPEFYTVSVLQACRFNDDKVTPDDMLKRVKTKVSKNTPLLRISYTNKSRDVSEKCLLALSAKLITEANSAYDEHIDVLNKQIHDYVKQVQDCELFLFKLKRRILEETHQHPPKLYNGYLNALVKQTVALSAIKHEMNKMEYYRVSSGTSPAGLSGDVKVVENSYGLVFLLVSGGSFGMICGLYYVFYSVNHKFRWSFSAAFRKFCKTIR